MQAHEPRAVHAPQARSGRRAGRPWLLLALLALAAGVRLYWALQPRIVWGDEPFYLWLGQSLLDGQGYQFFGISAAHFSPLYPLLAALGGRLLESLLGLANSAALQAGSTALYVLCGALFVLPIRGIAARIAGDSAGWAAGLTAAVYPALTAGVPLWGTMTEPLYLLLLATAWWSLLVALDEGLPSAYAVGGALLGLAYLVRTEALVYLVAALAALGLVRLFRKPAAAIGRGRRLLHLGRDLALILMAFAIAISPYLVVLQRQTGRWQLAEEAGSTYVSARGLAYEDVAAFDRATWGLDPASGEVYLFSPSSEGQGLAAAVAADLPGFARLLRANLHDLLDTTISARLLPWPLVALAGLGLFARPWSRRRLRLEAVLWASLAGPISFVLFFIQDRYVAGVLIPALAWIGAGLATLGEWLASLPEGAAAGADDRPASRERRCRRLLFALPALLLAAALLTQGPRLWEMLQQTRSFQPAHVQAAEKLRELGAGASDVVLSRYPAVAFHAGAAWAPTPAASWPEVLAYARSRGARYLVVDDWEVELRPQLRFLLEPGSAPPELRYIAAIEAGTVSVRIYELT